MHNDRLVECTFGVRVVHTSKKCAGEALVSSDVVDAVVIQSELLSLDGNHRHHSVCYHDFTLKMGFKHVCRTAIAKYSQVSRTYLYY